MIKPDGAVAIWTYGLAKFPNSPQASKLLHSFFHDDLGPYWAPHVFDLVERTHGALAPLPEEFSIIKKATTSMHIETPFKDFIGYLSSWSGYITFKNERPQDPDPLVKFESEARAALNLEDDSQAVTIEHEVPILIAKSPVAQG